MLEMRDVKKVVGAGKDADTIGIEALSFLVGDQELMQLFLDMSGIEADQFRSLVARPSFFVGLLDFILAHEPTLIDFAGAAELGPHEVEMARQALGSGRSPS